MNNKKLMIEGIANNNYPGNYKQVFKSNDKIIMELIKREQYNFVQINYIGDFLLAKYENIFLWFDVSDIWIENI